MCRFRHRIFIVDRINYLHCNILIEIDDTIVNRVIGQLKQAIILSSFSQIHQS